MAKLSPVFNSQVFDENGDPAVGWKIWTYQANSSTPLAAYTDAAGIVPHSNPIILDADGKAPNPIWITEGQSYKFVLRDENDVVKDSTKNNITGVNDASIAIDEWKDSGLSPTYVSATSFTVPGDQTSAFHAKRRFKATVTAGTAYGAFASSSYDGSSLTTVVTTNDSTPLDSGLSAVSLAVISAVNTSIPKIDNFTGTSQIVDEAVTLAKLAPNTFAVPTNFALAASVALNALTIAVKGEDGNDPSATNIVKIPVRNASGGYDVLPLTAATSLVVSSGSTLGTSNGVPHRLWIVGFNDTGTFRLGIINTQTANGIYPLRLNAVASAIAEGGAGAADTAGVFYAGAAVSSKNFVILGYIESTQATAGTWATAPSVVQCWAPGMPLPGDVMQTQFTSTGAVATGTTILPQDNTIPQSTEGDQFMSLSITPISAVNRLAVEAQLIGSHSANARVLAALFQDSTANALAATENAGPSAVVALQVWLFHEMRAGTTSATTFKVRAGGSAAGTFTFNGEGGVQLWGGVSNSYMRIMEIMA